MKTFTLVRDIRSEHFLCQCFDLGLSLICLSLTSPLPPSRQDFFICIITALYGRFFSPTNSPISSPSPSISFFRAWCCNPTPHPSSLSHRPFSLLPTSLTLSLSLPFAPPSYRSSLHFTCVPFQFFAYLNVALNTVENFLTNGQGQLS